MLEYIVKNNLLIFLFELGAAIAGLIFIKRSVYSRSVKLFVFYLWLVVFVEFIGFYSIYGYFTNYETLPFIKGTVLESNYWLYNGFAIIKFSIFYIYFLNQLEDSKIKKFLTYLSIVFIISAIINLFVSDVFFVKNSSFTSIGGTFILAMMILLYFYRLLRSNQVLYFYNNITFYIALGLLIWHLTVTPLFIYNQYFSSENPVFLSLHIWLLRAVNIYLYGSLMVGFIICSRKQGNDKAEDVKGSITG